MVKSINYNYINNLLERFLLPGDNHNYMSYSHANYLRNNFVDHGNSNHRYRILLPEELISITETDLWNLGRESLITDTDSLSLRNSPAGCVHKESNWQYKWLHLRKDPLSPSPQLRQDSLIPGLPSPPDGSRRAGRQKGMLPRLPWDCHGPCVGKQSQTKMIQCIPWIPIHFRYRFRFRAPNELPSDSKWLQAGKNYFRIIFGGSTGKSCKSPRGYYRRGSHRTGAHTGDYFRGIIFGGSTGKSCNSPGAITWENVYRIILVIISHSKRNSSKQGIWSSHSSRALTSSGWSMKRQLQKKERVQTVLRGGSWGSPRNQILENEFSMNAPNLGKWVLARMLEIFMLFALTCHSRLETSFSPKNFKLDIEHSPQFRAFTVWPAWSFILDWRFHSRLKISNPDANLECSQSLGPLK